jgi:hypothetical protein
MLFRTSHRLSGKLTFLSVERLTLGRPTVRLRSLNVSQFRLSPLQLAFSNFYFAIFFSFLFYFTFLISSHCVVFVTYSFYFTFHLTLLMGSCLLSQSLIIIIIIIIIIVPNRNIYISQDTNCWWLQVHI